VGQSPQDCRKKENATSDQKGIGRAAECEPSVL
jgi:hypothetical protein